MDTGHHTRFVGEGGPEAQDWELVARVKAGNDDAFNFLMERYRRPVLNFVFRMIGDAGEAEDLAQEVFVRAYRNMQKPAFRRTGAAFSTWLFQIARNAALDCLRHRKRHPSESLDRLENQGATTPDTGATPIDTAGAHEVGEQIAAAITRLPEDQRTAIILSEYEDLSYARIAAIMKCSEKSVEARLYRARKFLRKHLAHLIPN